jgi:phosphatidate cytidylyltransferase
MLWQRVLSSVVGLPIIFVAIWFGSPWFSLLVAVAALIGIIEFHSIFTQGKLRLPAYTGMVWVLVFLGHGHYAYSYDTETTRSIVTYVIVGTAIISTMLLALYKRSTEERPFIQWSVSMAGILYMGWMLSHWIIMRNSTDWSGREWVLIALLSTFAVDTTAYFVGRFFGKRKLAPSISPGKTWEGAAGGLIGSIAAVIILAFALSIETGYGKLVFIGLLIGIFAQAGDLAESKLKRVAGVKESGSVIPGHGGILDRLDSVVLTGVVVYYCLEWFL